MCWTINMHVCLVTNVLLITVLTGQASIGLKPFINQCTEKSSHTAQSTLSLDKTSLFWVQHRRYRHTLSVYCPQLIRTFVALAKITYHMSVATKHCTIRIYHQMQKLMLLQYTKCTWQHFIDQTLHDYMSKTLVFVPPPVLQLTHTETLLHPGQQLFGVFRPGLGIEQCGLHSTVLPLQCPVHLFCPKGRRWPCENQRYHTTEFTVDRLKHDCQWSTPMKPLTDA